jgi:hypothetical protein
MSLFNLGLPRQRTLARSHELKSFAVCHGNNKQYFVSVYRVYFVSTHICPTSAPLSDRYIPLYTSRYIE